MKLTLLILCLVLCLGILLSGCQSPQTRYDNDGKPYTQMEDDPQKTFFNILLGCFMLVGLAALAA